MTELVRWDPIMRDFGALTHRLDQALSSWEGAEQGFFGSWYPVVDIYDAGDDIVLHAELPGVKKDAIDIRVENSVLTLTGQREREVEYGRAYRSERAYGRFSRSFTLPAMVDTGRISATFRDGILTVHLPKVEQARPHQIHVKAA